MIDVSYFIRISLIILLIYYFIIGGTVCRVCVRMFCLSSRWRKCSKNNSRNGSRFCWKQQYQCFASQWPIRYKIRGELRSRCEKTISLNILVMFVCFILGRQRCCWCKIYLHRVIKYHSHDIQWKWWYSARLCAWRWAISWTYLVIIRHHLLDPSSAILSILSNLTYTISS